MSQIDWSEVQKTLGEAASKVADYARKEARDHGTPVFVEDDEGRWFKEYPDGRRVRLIRDDQGEREVPLA